MSGGDVDLAALGWALRSLPIPAGPALWMGARPGLSLPPGLRLTALQDFAPWCAALGREGHDCLPPPQDAGLHAAPPPPAQALILLSPARQREAARAEAARALAALDRHGVLLAAVANDAGAKAFEADLRVLCPMLEVHSKHKCRVLLARAEDRDPARILAWRDLDAARPLDLGGLLSTPLLGAPGLFAVDRIDAGSALLIEHLPANLSGAVADLGSGLGVLAAAALERSPGITSLDLFEASARAVALSRHNLRGATATVRVHWQDVTRTVDGRYDVVLCNPPFHAGARGLPEIGRAFIRAAARVLASDGQAWFVANAHLPYEAVLADCFDEVEILANARGFKLVRARHRGGSIAARGRH